MTNGKNRVVIDGQCAGYHEGALRTCRDLDDRIIKVGSKEREVLGHMAMDSGDGVVSHLIDGAAYQEIVPQMGDSGKKDGLLY